MIDDIGLREKVNHTSSPMLYFVSIVILFMFYTTYWLPEAAIIAEYGINITEMKN